MEPEPLYNNIEFKNIIHNQKIPTEDELLNTLFNKNSKEDYIHKDEKPNRSGNYNNVRFHKIKDTNSIITYRESLSFIFKYFYSNRETKELFDDLTISYQLLDDLNLESNISKEQDYENINNFFNNTIENNRRASNHAIAPQLYFAGFVKKKFPAVLNFTLLLLVKLLI